MEELYNPKLYPPKNYYVCFHERTSSIMLKVIRNANSIS